MWNLIGKYALLGIIRGIRGLSKHTKNIVDPKKPDKFNWKKISASILIACGIGVATEVVLNTAGFPVGLETVSEMFSGVLTLATPWFATGIIDDIVFKK